MSVEFASLEVRNKLTLSQSEFVTIFSNGNFTSDYHVELKKLIREKLKFDVNIKKKFNGKNTITVNFNCRSGSCTNAGSVSIKKFDIFTPEIVLDFKATCLHSTGD